MNTKTWPQAVADCITELPDNFSAKDAYAFEKALAKQFPDNQHVQAKIRQSLQILRDKGLLTQGSKRGMWKKVGVK